MPSIIGQQEPNSTEKSNAMTFIMTVSENNELEYESQFSQASGL